MQNKDKNTDNSEKISFKERIGESLDIPADLLCGGCTVELRGRGEALVGGCRRITVFNENEIRMEMADFDLIISGVRLCCPAFGDKKLLIGGRIESVRFEERS